MMSSDATAMTCVNCLAPELPGRPLRPWVNDSRICPSCAALFAIAWPDERQQAIALVAALGRLLARSTTLRLEDVVSCLAHRVRSK